MGNYLPLRLTKTIVQIFDNRIQAQPQHVLPNQRPDFHSKYEYYLNICNFIAKLERTNYGFTKPICQRDRKNENLNLDHICCSETKQHYLVNQFRHGSVFQVSRAIFWEILL